MRKRKELRRVEELKENDDEIAKKNLIKHNYATHSSIR